MSPFGFFTITKLDTQSVGSLTLVKTPRYSKSSSFFFNYFCRENGTFLGACTVGVIEGSILISYSSPICPIPVKTLEYSSIFTSRISFEPFCSSAILASFSKILMKPNSWLLLHPKIVLTFSLTTTNYMLYSSLFLLQRSCTFPIDLIIFPLYTFSLVLFPVIVILFGLSYNFFNICKLMTLHVAPQSIYNLTFVSFISI